LPAEPIGEVLTNVTELGREVRMDEGNVHEQILSERFKTPYSIDDMTEYEGMLRFVGRPTVVGQELLGRTFLLAFAGGTINASR